MYLSIGPEIPAPDHGTSLLLATEAFENLESVGVVRLNVGVEMLPTGLAEWTTRLPNLRVLSTDGVYASKVLEYPLLAEISQHPRLQTFTISPPKWSHNFVACLLRQGGDRIRSNLGSPLVNLTITFCFRIFLGMFRLTSLIFLASWTLWSHLSLLTIDHVEVMLQTAIVPSLYLMHNSCSSESTARS